jgi:hypothetical protein
MTMRLSLLMTSKINLIFAVRGDRRYVGNVGQGHLSAQFWSIMRRY